jgi:EpsI family protein
MSINRRELVVAGICTVAAGAAYGLTPHRHVSLLGPDKIDNILPRQVQGWTSRDYSDMVAPATTDSLSALIYDEVVTRIYQNNASGAEIMMLMAHGPSQTNELQLHRPEICYPAFGLNVQSSNVVQQPLAPGVTLPVRALVTQAPDHQESVIYWTRLGEYFPLSPKEQHYDRLRTAMKGFIADGVLARFSMVGQDSEAAFSTMGGFIPLLVQATAPAHRAALIGEVRTQAMAADHV